MNLSIIQEDERVKKLWITLLAGLLVVPLLFQAPAQAATPISIYIDGVRLATDQAPIMVQGRTMLPLRAIFEALGAKILWNQKTQTATAIKDDTTIVLKIGSKVATINNEAVTLDVPGQNLKGRTMVPVRFVGEALGQEVGWNSKTQTVTITSDGSNGNNGNGSVNPVSYVTVKDIGDAGDGRDLQVSFSKSSNESLVDHYRVMVVKAANAYNFNLSAAQRVTSSNYSTVLATGSDPAVKLTANSRDVDGNLIGSNQAYVAFVLAVGKGNNASALSSASSTITLDNGNYVSAATNVKASDISDNGDGRDLSVSFTRPQVESNIASYRILIVKTKDVGSFNLNAANNVSSQNYTTVYKSSGSNNTLTGTLTSSSRDTSGELIKNGVAYTAYVLSISSNTAVASNKLSSGSATLTLNASPVTAPIITSVEDINDYGDGRDLRVNFTKLSDESKISSYRIFVVKASDYGNFNLTKANAVSSSNYTQVNKTGYNISQILSSGARDVDGITVRNGVSYRVFVMAIGSGTNAGTNALSAASQAITLSNNSVGTVSSLNVKDDSDYGDGRDMRVSFTRASDESNISSYRIMVVPTDYFGNNFSLSDANNVSSSYYTEVSRGSNYNDILPYYARDVRGGIITNNKSYRVYVLSVGYGSYSGNNALSTGYQITLTNNFGVSAITNLTLTDVSDNNDSSDLQVSFTRAKDESNIGEYRIIVVPASSNLSSTQISNTNYYTAVYKTGSNTTLTKVLPSLLKDATNSWIKNGIKYKVYVLSVGSGNYYGTNTLSAASEITLTPNKGIGAVKSLSATDVSDNGNGSDLRVSFTPPDESNISGYRIFVVKSGSKFNPSTAIELLNTGTNYTVISKKSSYNEILATDAKDTDGQVINNDVSYTVYVLSVGSGSYLGTFELSPASSPITLRDNSVATAVTGLSAVVDGNTGIFSDILISFNRLSNEKNVLNYRVLIVPSLLSDNFLVENAKNAKEFTVVPTSGETVINTKLTNIKDAYNQDIDTTKSYQVFVLTVGQNGSYALSNGSDSITFDVTPE